jgi:hypothetical protein
MWFDGPEGRHGHGQRAGHFMPFLSMGDSCTCDFSDDPMGWPYQRDSASGHLLSKHGDPSSNPGIQTEDAGKIRLTNTVQWCIGDEHKHLAHLLPPVHLEQLCEGGGDCLRSITPPEAYRLERLRCTLSISDEKPKLGIT